MKFHWLTPSNYFFLNSSYVIGEVYIFYDVLSDRRPGHGLYELQRLGRGGVHAAGLGL